VRAADPGFYLAVWAMPTGLGSREERVHKSFAVVTAPALDRAARPPQPRLARQQRDGRRYGSRDCTSAPWRPTFDASSISALESPSAEQHREGV